VKPRWRLVGFAIPAMLSFAGAVNAATFDFSYSFPTSDTTDFPSGFTSASGVFTATAEGGGAYLVTGASGEWNGETITGIEAPGADAATEDSTNDNLIFPGSSPELDLGGVEFTVSGPIAGDLGYGLVDVFYETTGDAGYSDDSLSTGFSPTFNLTPAGVPEPGAWMLMILGIGVLGAMSRGRRAVKALTA